MRLRLVGPPPKPAAFASLLGVPPKRSRRLRGEVPVSVRSVLGTPVVDRAGSYATDLIVLLRSVLGEDVSIPAP
eukprot:4959682-Alexandrium_andersonii.AAC.1